MRVAPCVRHACVDGHRVILNLMSEKYLIIDRVGSAFWAALAGEQTLDEAFQKVAERYDVGEDALRRDFGYFKQRCLEQGLFVASGGSEKETSPGGRVTAFSKSAIYCLAVTARMLKRKGLFETYKRYERLRRGFARPNLRSAC